MKPGQQWTLLGALAVQGCSSVTGSAYGQGPEANVVSSANLASVRIVALVEPNDMRELGIIEAHGATHHLSELMEEFRRQAARLGGHLAKIDRLSSQFHTETQTYSESYSCGSSTSPRTCSRMSSRQVEVEVIAVQGRAFR